MRVKLSSEEFTEIAVTQGTLQNLSPQAAIEIVTEETENSGIVLYPRQKLTFSHETTVYARSVWDTVTDGETVILAVEPIFNQAGGRSDVNEWQLWSDFEADHVYSVGEVFRTADTPSWGYWQVTTAGTSGDETTAPSGTTEGNTATSGIMQAKLMRLGSSTGNTWKQITKTGVSASAVNPVDVLCPLGGSSTDLCLLAPCVLKYVAGATDLTTLCAFNTGDAADYVYDAKYVEWIGGYMQLKTAYEYPMTTPVAFEDGYISTVDINLTQFKSVATLAVVDA